MSNILVRQQRTNETDRRPRDFHYEARSNMRKVYVFWTGDNAMSEARRSSLDSMATTGCEVVLVDTHNLHDFVPAQRIHPAYPFLNLAHRADYLRCYFMKHFGGGYADLKPISHSWTEAFELLESDPNLWGIGYREVNRNGVANIYASSRQLNENPLRRLSTYIRWRLMRRQYKDLIGLCAFAFKPDTPFVNEWWDELNRRLDRLLPALQKTPARHPRERPGEIYAGEASRYPVPWTYVLGDIFHPLILKYRNHMNSSLPPPGFKDYL